MSRYWKVLRRFWGAALAAEMEYRANFVLASLNSVGGLAGSVFGLYLFYRVGHRLGGWSWEEALIVMGLFTFLDGFTGTCLSPNLNRIVQHVRDGTLDFILLKPIDTQFWLSTRNFSIWGVPNLVLGLGLVGFAGTRLGLGPADYARGIVPVLIGAMVLYGLWFMLSTLSIWFVKVHNVTSVLRGVLEAGRFPVPAFPAAYRLVFTFVIPIVFLTTVPAQAILGQATRWAMLASLGLAVALLVLSRCFWRFALRFYTSASS